MQILKSKYYGYVTHAFIRMHLGLGSNYLNETELVSHADIMYDDQLLCGIPRMGYVCVCNQFSKDKCVIVLIHVHK